MTKASILSPEQLVEADARSSKVCNFRVSNREQYNEWVKYKTYSKEKGLDICYIVISLIRAWNKSVEVNLEPESINLGTQVVNLQMQNTFIYQPQRPRREPNPSVISSRNVFSGTINRLCQESYVAEKARELDRSFCFRDFMELGHSLFRKIILRLKRKRKIIPLEPRSNPRMYVLHEWIDRYPTMSGNVSVKQMFSPLASGVIAGEGDR